MASLRTINQKGRPGVACRMDRGPWGWDSPASKCQSACARGERVCHLSCLPSHDWWQISLFITRVALLQTCGDLNWKYTSLWVGSHARYTKVNLSLEFDVTWLISVTLILCFQRQGAFLMVPHLKFGFSGVWSTFLSPAGWRDWSRKREELVDIQDTPGQKD